MQFKMKSPLRHHMSFFQLITTFCTILVMFWLIFFSLSSSTFSLPAFYKEKLSAHRGVGLNTSNNVFHLTNLEIQHVWEWEIASGHYPSENLPERIIESLDKPISNPGLPNETNNTRNGALIHGISFKSPVTGSGLPRRYIDPRMLTPSSSSRFLTPIRPSSGSIADLDVIMQKCGRTTSNCLKFLRFGAGLDDFSHYSNGYDVLQSSYIYLEEGKGLYNRSRYSFQTTSMTFSSRLIFPPPLSYYTHSDLLNSTLSKNALLESNTTLDNHVASSNSSPFCDPNHPRIFHSFWSGPFTSHTYMMILSFLYTQNLGLSSDEIQSRICRPRLWIWIWDPRSLAPDTNAERDLHRTLAHNMWSRPFLHPRFKGLIEFKLWNMYEQLDATGDALKGWRSILGLLEGTGSSGDKSFRVISGGKAYNKLSPKLLTIMSDTARFTLTYLYGGIYIDVDTLFLRDWEELWGYRGAFAYKWSHIKDEYNTAVLKMNKNSMLGNVLLRAARRGRRGRKWWDWRKGDVVSMEFHPKDGISKYVEEMDLVLPIQSNGRSGLLWMLPVALFDPAWLATDGYEPNGLTIPSFKRFRDFFDTPYTLPHEAERSGFDGFFRGAYSYHWHNHWHLPFDKNQNYPDWGDRLIEYTRELERTYPTLNTTHTPDVSSPTTVHSRLKWSELTSIFSSWKWPWHHHSIQDKNSLPWSAVIKRTMEAFIRGEAPNLYGEYLAW